ncbi:hypothetical protein [Streptomyces anulatus]|uniref:ApeA N-terminal domain 1-containing protein n=1 Tax=Streptomyces anulatus TaxID=1892 RepID=UPI00341ABD44
MAARRNINFGDSITGMLVDGVEETPYVAATLTLNEETGLRVAVPYVDELRESHNSTSAWFEGEMPPRNLLLVSLEGNISLFGCKYSGHSVNLSYGVGVGKITPSEMVLGHRDGDHEDPLLVKELRSEIDGLRELTGFSSIKQSGVTDEEGRTKKVTIEISALQEMAWSQGSAEMKFASNWVLNPVQSGLAIDDGVGLVSRFPEGQSIDTHLREHRKVASLLSFLFGCPIYFRRHEVRDPRFAQKTMTERVVDIPFRQVVTQNTVKDHAKPVPPKRRLQNPLARGEVINGSALEAWSNSYEEWGRFIFPALSSLNRPGAILENLVVNAAMSMEAAGSLIGSVSGEADTYTPGGKPKTATFMYRCLVRTGWRWGELCDSVTGLAQAIANNYNTIKHFDRGEFPSQVETYLIGSTMNLVVRMLAVRLANPSDNTSVLFGDFIHDFEGLKEDFANHGLRVNDSGNFTAHP